MCFLGPRENAYLSASVKFGVLSWAICLRCTNRVINHSSCVVVETMTFRQLSNDLLFYQIWPWHANTYHQGIVGRYLGKFCLAVIARRTYSHFWFMWWLFIRCRLLSSSSPSCSCLVPLDFRYFRISLFRREKNSSLPPPPYSQWREKEGRGKGRAGPRAQFRI